jgi:Uncharacterized conserved protein
MTVTIDPAADVRTLVAEAHIPANIGELIAQTRAAGNARALISDTLFGRLVAGVAKDHPEHAGLAERIVDQALVFLLACAALPDIALAPSRLVDYGWHGFIQRTVDYADICQRLGRFVHHVPIDEPGQGGGATVARTVLILRELGLPVDQELWTGSAVCEGSGTGSCSQCHQGCVDSN